MYGFPESSLNKMTSPDEAVLVNISELELQRATKFCHLANKVTRVARMLAAKPTEPELEQKSCTVMALLDGGTLKRHKSWLKVLYSLF